MGWVQKASNICRSIPKASARTTSSENHCWLHPTVPHSILLSLALSPLCGGDIPSTFGRILVGKELAHGRFAFELHIVSIFTYLPSCLPSLAQVLLVSSSHVQIQIPTNELAGCFMLLFDSNKKPHHGAHVCSDDSQGADFGVKKYPMYMYIYIYVCIYIYVYTYISICQRFSYKIVIFHCHAKDPAEPCTLKQDIDLSTCQKRCATSWICRKAEDGTSQIHWLNLLNDQIYCVYVYIYTLWLFNSLPWKITIFNR